MGEEGYGRQTASSRHCADLQAVQPTRRVYGAAADRLTAALDIACLYAGGMSFGEFNGGIEGLVSFGDIRDLIDQRMALLDALKELHATVVGECPRLLNEDCGGNSALALRIEKLLAGEVP